MTASERIRLARMGREYLELCNEGERLGVPVSLEDQGSPRTVSGLREAIEQAKCEECDKPATHLSGVGNGYHMNLCAEHTNHRLGMYASAPQPCKQPWFRSIG